MAAERRTRTPRPTRHETRAALLAAAAEVIARRGFGAATVEAITEAAGFSRGAFYSNFATKHELAVALAEACARRDGDAPIELDEREEVQLWLELVLHASRDAAFRRGLAAVCAPLPLVAVASASTALGLELPLERAAPQRTRRHGAAATPGTV